MANFIPKSSISYAIHVISLISYSIVLENRKFLAKRQKSVHMCLSRRHENRHITIILDFLWVEPDFIYPFLERKKISDILFALNEPHWLVRWTNSREFTNSLIWPFKTLKIMQNLICFKIFRNLFFSNYFFLNFTHFSQVFPKIRPIYL